jgi:hypothetical protein
MSTLFEYKKRKFQNFVYDNQDNIDWYKLTFHNLIDADFILKNPQFPWDLKSIHLNPNINAEDLIKKFNNFKIENKEEVSISFIKNHNLLETFDVDTFCDFSSNIVNDVETYKNIKWNWRNISMNYNITEEFIIKHLDKLDSYFLSSNKAVSIDFILNTHFDWDFDAICQNPNMTTKYVFILRKKIMNWGALTLNESIPISFILDTPQFYWDYDLLSQRKDLTIEIIEKHSEIKWNWINICINSESIPISFLKNFVNKTDFFPNRFEKFNCLTLLKYNQNLSVDDLSWIPEALTNSNFEGGVCIFNKLINSEKEYKIFLDSLIFIQNAFMKCYWFPEYKICRNRLKREFEELMKE